MGEGHWNVCLWSPEGGARPLRAGVTGGDVLLSAGARDQTRVLNESSTYFKLLCHFFSPSASVLA